MERSTENDLLVEKIVGRLSLEKRVSAATWSIDRRSRGSSMKFKIKFNYWFVFTVVILMVSPASLAQTEAGNAFTEESWNAKFQTTVIWQDKPSFTSPYTGVNSLYPDTRGAYSITGTAFLGARAWKSAEFYFNVEMISAVPFSNLHGLGGLTNSEQQKTSGARPNFYIAREFLRQTFLLGGDKVQLSSGPNQMASEVEKRRFVLTLGRFAILDVFDTNAYAHDGRTQFSNWAFFTFGAFDYAADTRGYSVGVAVELYYDDWVFRFGRFEGPEQSNGFALDSDLIHHYGDQLEIEHAHILFNQAGKLRILGFRNQEVMGKFSDANTLSLVSGDVPEVADVRKLQTKLGWGASFEQGLCDMLGMFARASFSDGQTETYTFTEIESSLAAGIVAKGHSWRRDLDTLGLAFAQNGLGLTHQTYLSKGGVGAFLGDGQLRYAPERIIDSYYNFNIFQNTFFGPGIQYILNPGYNADRGPVIVGMLRVHSDF